MTTKQNALMVPARSLFDAAVIRSRKTGRAIAEETGISTSDISRFRKGLEPPQKHWAALASAVNSTEEELGWNS